ncbi:cytochrome c3 family protein [Campylobacter geochelonis]|uniref:Fumarate reductase flavoprotein subunit n=1 Tax=Campylobacter geochelonis TaxID=1780362 RepID=A0A128EBB5_9BACT|nr:cytochrome c3 family protein [Campylobacter geochelonis]QKF70410.1 cytochrome c3 [Campylobacter geochelonis]CZE46284.1 fumarate reductase flavoprotein subunit [Campylobacter geochelonis]CZE46348.1 fumarate reductase flavoprotein subunit [Campylobacter geochelonis]
MLKIYTIFASLLLVLALNLNANNTNKYDKANYPFKAHESLQFDCKNCHKESNPQDYKRLNTNECLSCHKSYEKLAEQTGHLGYDDNVHASPHYPNMDCNTCHSTHKQSKNYCVMCHSQNGMKKLLVP